jgi:hypothetical protein
MQSTLQLGQIIISKHLTEFLGHCSDQAVIIQWILEAMGGNGMRRGIYEWQV